MLSGICIIETQGPVDLESRSGVCRLRIEQTNNLSGEAPYERLCGLFLLLGLLTLALGIALANSGNLGVDGYPCKKVLIVIFENTDYQGAISQPSFLRIA